MKVVMINDCAYVGETILKFLPEDLEKIQIKRSRGLWSKTFGIAWKILRAKGDVYHVHYLLQDCYLASRFGKRPLIGHAHGSDIRSIIRHFMWGRLVRYNLKKCDKILVSSPDLLDIAKEYQEDADYVPNPVDTDLFFPKPLAPHEGKRRVLIASKADWKVKGTALAIHALNELKDDVEVYMINYGRDVERTKVLAKSLGLSLNILPKTSHENLRTYFWDSDVVLDQFKLGGGGQIDWEGIACGRPVVTYISSEYPSNKDFPLKDVNTVEKIVAAVKEASGKLWMAEYAYLKRKHDPRLIAQRILKLYENMVG